MMIHTAPRTNFALSLPLSLFSDDHLVARDERERVYESLRKKKRKREKENKDTRLTKLNCGLEKC